MPEHLIERDLDGLDPEWVAAGVERFEECLAKYAAFADFCDARDRAKG